MAGDGAFERLPLPGTQAAPHESESPFLRDLQHRDASVTSASLRKAAASNPALSFSGWGAGKEKTETVPSLQLAPLYSVSATGIL